MSRQIAAKVVSDGKTIQDLTFFLITHEKPCTYKTVWTEYILKDITIPCKNVELLDVYGKNMNSSGSSIKGHPDADIITAMEGFNLNTFTFALTVKFLSLWKKKQTHSRSSWKPRVSWAIKKFN